MGETDLITALRTDMGETTPGGDAPGTSAGTRSGTGESRSGDFTALHRDRAGRLTLSADPGAAAALEVIHEDDTTRILRYVIHPGERTGWHSHELDFITVHLSHGTMTGYSVNPGQDHSEAILRPLTFTPGRVVPHHAPLEHDAVNDGSSDIVLLEIEFKDATVTVKER